MAHLLNIKINQSALATLLVLLFIIPSLSPIVDASDAEEPSTAGRSSLLDFTFGAALQLGGSGSAINNSMMYLEPGTHTITVNTTAEGNGQDRFWLQLQHKGSPLLGFSDVGSPIMMGTITGDGGKQYLPLTSFTWEATPGAGQELQVKIRSDLEAGNELLNNIQPLGIPFSVENLHFGSVVQDDIEEPKSHPNGFTGIMLPNAITNLTATVSNDGVKSISAQMVVTITQLFPVPPTPVTLTLFSNSKSLEPGAYPTTPLSVQESGVLYVELDSTSFAGGSVWEFKAEVNYLGTAWNWTETVESTFVKFSDYNAEVLEPSVLVGEPGETVVMTFILKNTGTKADGFDTDLSQQLNWTMADTGVSSVVPPANTASSVVLVHVTIVIPANASRGDSNKITLNFTSTYGTLNGTNYVINAIGRVMVGDFFNGSVAITKPSNPKTIAPGGSQYFTATISNTGSVATAFTLSAGLSVNALNWTVELSNPTTAYILPGGTNIVQITVSAPPIQSPMVIGSHTMAFESLNVWIQSQPIGGGIPVTDQVPLSVKPIITVDPGLNAEPYVISAEELYAMKSGTQFNHIAELNLRVFNNLPQILTANDIGNVTAIITLNTNFTASNGGGFAEADRWNVSIVNPVYRSDKPEFSDDAEIIIFGPPMNEFPLAGTLSIEVTITSTLSTVLRNAGVEAPSITQIYTIIIPPIVEGSFTQSTIDAGPYDVAVGAANSFGMRFENTGNDAASYRLRVIENLLPQNWSANFSEADTFIENLTSDLADGNMDSVLPEGTPGKSYTHTRVVMFNIQTDPLAPSNSIQPITVRIEDPITGQIIGDEFVFNVIVGQIYNATLSPTNQTFTMTEVQQNFATVFIRNTGNAPTDFSISLDTTDAGNINFEIVKPLNKRLYIAAGFEEEIRIKMTANAGANANDFYMSTIRVTDDLGEIDISANIVANISTQSNYTISAPEQISVTPGMQEKVDYTVTNIGNALGQVQVKYEVENMTLSVDSVYHSIQMGQNISDQVIISVPSLGGEQSLIQGDVFDLTINVHNASNPAIEYSKKIVRLLVQPLFLVESYDWPSVMEFKPRSDRQWEVTFTNTGNQDVTVNLLYAITRPGLSNLSLDWGMNAGAATQIVLPRNTPVVHTFGVMGNVLEPLLTTTADLTLYLVPVNTSIEGSGEFTTQLVMSRLFSPFDIDLKPKLDDGPVDIDLSYTHIPITNGSKATYSLELCKSVRLRDISALGQNPINYSWNFTLVQERTDAPAIETRLNLEQECGSTSFGPTSRYVFPEVEPWNPSTFTIIADIPNRGSILPGDGWDLTFRLYHLDEHSNYTQYSEETFTILLAVFADPAINEVTSSNSFEEGIESVIDVVVQNIGSAKALDVVVSLHCDGLIVSTKDGESPNLITGSVTGGIEKVMIKEFAPGATQTLQWIVTSESIDWWSQSKDASCTAKLNASYMDGNNIDNDEFVLESEVASWSPGVQNSFIACVISLLVSFILFRLTAQNDNFRLLGIYAGVIGLGFSFHIFAEAWWGFVILALSAIWIWRVTWGSTEEFRLLHEDYQRARKGVSTLYADHFEELSNTRRQLSVILAVPVLGMLAIILGVNPNQPRIPVDQTNIISLVAYVGVIILGVWVLIKRADTMYGSLYGRLTDIEVKSVRLERDLGDPARLFNELAADGLNLDEIFGDADPSRPLTTDATSSNEEVNDDA